MSTFAALLGNTSTSATNAALLLLNHPRTIVVDENEDPSMPWEEEGWVPRTASGKPKTPNMIRNQLQKYIDNSTRSQTDIVHNELGVNYNSFGKFMNPKTYKNQWSATSNGTYWAAAKLLEKHAYEQKQAKKKNKSAKKRKSDASDDGGPSPSNKKAKKPSTENAVMDPYLVFMAKVNATALSENETQVYDSCPQVIKKIKDFLQRDGVTKSSFCHALGDINSNSLNRFLSSKKQDGAGMVAYERAYFFFEKMRLLEGTKKSKARLTNEASEPNGFSLRAPSKHRWVLMGRM